MTTTQTTTQTTQPTAETTQSARPVAGDLAHALAADLQAAGVPGRPRATTTGGTNHAVVLTRPGGGDWVVVGVEAWPTGPVYYATGYAADDPARAVAHHETSSHAEALAVVLDLLTA
ncbi:hypothetical protein [Oerskovia sp. Root22]|uniref:hypothetical protein n=1 Tax=Oerskovia sp. Root22 TaxID=1736494 RepID=UPI0006F34E81|nr:hypothetical protein [Oerskovia sp. Root22]KRC43010.1 hypothetical protein ASE15_03365 [Oerskovia sp. Root22]